MAISPLSINAPSRSSPVNSTSSRCWPTGYGERTLWREPVLLVGDPICHFYAATFIAAHRRALGRLNSVRGLSALGHWLIRRATLPILNSFFFVGITAEFARHAALLALKLRSAGIAANIEGAPRLNQSLEFRSGLETDDARHLLHRLEYFCREDEYIYRRFLRNRPGVNSAGRP